MLRISVFLAFLLVLSVSAAAVLVERNVTAPVTTRTARTPPRQPKWRGTPVPTQTAAPANEVTRAGVTGFLGTTLGMNTNAIASWFRTNSVQDSTNGNSWCGYPYNDNTPGFAPDVTTMLNNFGGDYLKAGPAYCGLEAEFETPDGRKITLYIADGFDSKWVLTPTSVDIVYNHFPKFFGRTTTGKNDVVQGVKWRFTGNRNHDLRFRGYGFS